jgi:hypothetical protein
MEALKDASHLYEVEHRARYLERPGFRIQELQLSRTQKVPWHYHNNVSDTFYVLKGHLRIFLQNQGRDPPRARRDFQSEAGRPHSSPTAATLRSTF